MEGPIWESKRMPGFADGIYVQAAYRTAGERQELATLSAGYILEGDRKSSPVLEVTKDNLEAIEAGIARFIDLHYGRACRQQCFGEDCLGTILGEMEIEARMRRTNRAEILLIAPTTLI